MPGLVRVVSLYSQRSISETNEELNPQQQQEDAKGWREQDDVAKEAEEARKEREQKQQAEEEERKANPGVYRPGAGILSQIRNA